MGTANEPQKKASTSVLITILGKENVKSDRIARRDGVQVIEVRQGEKVAWENTQSQVCTITFTKGGCAFGHGHEQCRFTIEPLGARKEDIVIVEAGREFEFSAQFEKNTKDDHRGTPKIIVTG